VISVATIPNYKKCFSNETVVSISNLKEIEQAIKTNFVDGFNVPIIVDESSVKLFEIADKVAQTDATILISGETGTGKEVLAKYIHKKSARSNNNFVAINCAAIPENLLESELFGHEKGAFTNAYQKRIGKFEEAHHGTILLDEISEMPLLLQAKLLRVIQEKEFCRLGSNEKIKVDVRIIATSNKNLEKAVEAGTFREDLFYRLNIIPLEILPLRNRRADIIPLAVFFCKKYSNSHKQMTKELLDQLSLLKWKGNVRELENFVQRAIILSSKDAIDLEDVILKKSESTDCEIKTLDQIEKNAILEALKKFDGNKAIVSEKLGISARTLRYKLHTYKNQKTDSNLVA
ncbi:MAG: sigma-54-dependent Fis family transcriptional regulator, partial [Alphaproteobacteria bacterium]|nr:sigma-54-dependent Fis family transcriptional regulator [Alphaproteobacteria bacterium]